jgi:hypothetical protein
VRGTYELPDDYQECEEPQPYVSEGSQTGSELPSVDLSGCELEEEQLSHLKDCLRRKADVFSKTQNDRGLTNLVEHTINTGMLHQ